VGPNNSGKSSLLQFFYEFRQLFVALAVYQANIASAIAAFAPLTVGRNVLDLTQVFCNLNARDLSIELTFEGTASLQRSLTQVRLDVRRNFHDFRIVPLQDGLNGPVDVSRGAFGIIGTPPFYSLAQSNVLVFNLYDFIRLCEELSETFYIDAFRNILNLSAQEDYFDIKIGEAFVKQRKVLKLGPSRASNDLANRVEADIKRIFGYTELQINPSHDDRTLHLTIDGKNYKLPELGSGLAQFILTLANVANASPAYILIDEPELNLHPALQLDS
jgi:hypothetical protein